MNIKNLPVYNVLTKIYKLYEQNDVLIISTPTGSGKTLLVPSFIQQMTKKNVFVTVPRVLLSNSARNAAIRFIYGNEKSVGVINGKIKINPYAPLVFGTEMSFLQSKNIKPHTLIIDEAHEGKKTTEPVFYYGIDHVKRGGKLIISSATISVKEFKAFYNKKGFKVGVVELPEEEKVFQSELIKVDSIENWIEENQNNKILIGVPGKEEGEKLAASLKRYKHKIFFLHSEIEEWEEEEILSYDGNCIIMATVVAMSGITFKDLDVVIPPSEQKQIVNNKLTPVRISLAEVKQWMGRVGRVKPGKIVVTHDFFLNRKEYPIPEILREDLADTVLTFCSIGYDLRKIEILNQPEPKNIKDAFKALYLDNILKSDKDIDLTSLGNYVMQNGEGILKGLFAFYGDEMGVGATARKIAELISLSNPYRKCTYSYFKEWIKKYPNLKESQHLLYVKIIEEDVDAHYTNSELLNNLVKEYIMKHSIFGRGVNRLKRKFEKIDEVYNDINNIDDLYKELLLKISKRFIFVNGTNQMGIDVVSDIPTFNNISFCSLSPIALRDGMLADLVTILSKT